MSIDWFSPNGGSSYRQTLPRLISSFLEPIDPTPALDESFYLAKLLLLSNQINKAHELISALYKHKDEITPTSPTYDTHVYNVLQYFYQVHRSSHPPPKNEAQFEPIVKRTSKTLEECMAGAQWGKYRESCRTGWMLEHCSLPEPDDPHIWRETDDPRMLAMCCRLLAKDKTPGQCPPQEQIREALAAGLKLYAQPQVPVEEYVFDSKTENFKKRHSYLLYRRLVVELAIRAGELDTAAEVLSNGLKLDGVNGSDGGTLENYLFVTGIYDVLPLLAQGGKTSNPFYINDDDAETLVREIIATVELRAKEGRQWSLAPGKVGWKELLDRLAEGAWKVNTKEYSGMGLSRPKHILYPPATEEEIEAAEGKFGELPADFKEMIRVANGFRGGWHLFGGGIAGIRDMYIPDNADFDAYEEKFYEKGLKQDGDISGEMIALSSGTESDTFCFYIIPPAMWKDNVVGREVEDGEYQFWQTCSWRGEAYIWDSVRDFVASSVEEVETMIERGERADDYYESE